MIDHRQDRALLGLAMTAGGFTRALLCPSLERITADGDAAISQEENVLAAASFAEAVDVPAAEVAALPPRGDWLRYCDRRGHAPVLLLLRRGSTSPTDATRIAEVVFNDHAARVGLAEVRSALRRRNAILSGVETMTHIGIWQVGLTSGRTSWSDETYRICGIDPSEATPSLDDAIALFPEEVRGLVRNYLDDAIEQKSGFNFVLPFRRADGVLRTVRSVGYVVTDDDAEDYLFGIIQDVTDEREAQLHLWWTANHDTLTGLPNRMLWQERLSHALEMAQKRNQAVGLILADLDHFKSINDVYGHEAGDEVLKAVADRLTAHMRQGDTLARLGGDEFAIIVNELAEPDDLERPLQRLVSAANVDFGYRGTAIPVTLSLGAAVFPRDADDARELYRNADLALFRTKADPQRRGTLYDPRYGLEQEGREKRVRLIREAIDAQEIVPCYQPVVHLGTGRPACVEALTRWRDGERLLDVSAFPTAFEDAELAPLLGLTLIDQISRDWRIMRAELGDVPALSLNVSLRQLQNLSFVSAINRMLDEGVVKGPDLILEVKVDPLASLSRHVRPAFLQLLKRGVSISFDSLVSGVSVLVEPGALAVRQIKVSWAAIEQSEEKGRAGPVIRGMIDTCRNLGIELVACEIETQEELRRVRGMGFRLAQGFQFARPMRFDVLLGWLRQVEPVASER